MAGLSNVDLSDPSPLKLLLVGRTGNGKSSTGNSILGSKEFAPTTTISTTPQQPIKAKSPIEGKGDVIVVDGIEADDEGNGEDTVKAKRMTDIAFQICPEGFDAILIVLKYGVRFTKQEKDAVKMIRSVFGEKVVKRHGIIVMTHGDNFDRDCEDEEMSFQQWCKLQTGDVQSLYKESDQRWVLFDNKTKDENLRRDQRNILFSLVEKVKASSGPYTKESYAVLEENDRKERVKRDTTRELNEIQRGMDEMDGRKNHKTNFDLQKLKNMKNKLEDRKRGIKDPDMPSLRDEMDKAMLRIDKMIERWERGLSENSNPTDTRFLQTQHTREENTSCWWILCYLCLDRREQPTYTRLQSEE